MRDEHTKPGDYLMLPRRIAEAIRQQDWATIAIEFVLIVVGVLFALQVDTWNSNVRDGELEHRYIQRLHDELQENILYFQRRLEKYEPYDAVLKRYYEFLEDGATGLPDLDGLDLCKYGINYYSAFDTSVYEELVSSGRLGLITRSDALDALQKFRETLRGRATFLDSVSDVLREAYNKLDPYRARVPIAPKSGGAGDDATRKSCVFDYESFQQATDAASLIAEIQGVEFAFVVAFTDLLKGAREAQEALEAAYPQQLTSP